MDSSAAFTGLARLSGLLVSEHDPLSVITSGLTEACAQVDADAGGVLVVSDGDLDVLAATSHRAADLEAYQAGVESGPCVDSMRAGLAISVESPEEADARWPGFGARMAAAGYHRAHAVPMVWQGGGVGGLSLFWTAPGALDEAEVVTLQAFADILTIAVVHVRPVAMNEALERLQDALATRTSVERAKGVLAFQRNTDLEGAYQALLELAGERDLSLSEAAQAVVDGACRGETL